MSKEQIEIMNWSAGKSLAIRQIGVDLERPAQPNRFAMRIKQFPIFLLLCFAAGWSAGCGGDVHMRAQKQLNSAQQHIKGNKPNEALIELRRAIQLDPKLAEAHFEMGKVFLAKGNVGPAFRELSIAVKLNPGLREPQELIADILLRAGEIDAAKDKAEFILREWPGDKVATLIQAEAQIATSQLDTAKALLKQVADEDPDNVRALFDSALIYLHEKEWDKAEANLSRAGMLAPDQVAPMVLLGRSLEARGQADRAQQILERFAQSQPNSVAAQLVLADFYNRQNRLPEAELLLKRIRDLGEQDPNVRGILAQFYLASDRKPEAEVEYKKILAADPKDHLNAMRLADLYYGEKRFGEARAIIDKVLREDSHNIQALTARGMLNLDANASDAAISDFQQTLKIDPNFTTPKFHLARAYFQKGSLEQAKVALAEIIQQDPKAITALSFLAELEVKTNQFDAALEHAEKAAALDPKFAPATILVSQLLVRKGQLRPAEDKLRKLLPTLQDPRLLEQAIPTLAAIDLAQKNYADVDKLAHLGLEADPKSTIYLSLLAQPDLMQKQPDIGIAKIQAYLRQNPWAGGYDFLGQVAAQNGKMALAEEALKKAVELDPNLATASLNLGSVYALKGDQQQAISVLEALASKNSNDVLSRTRLAQVYESQGEWTKAQGLYENILKTDSNNIVVKNNLAWLYANHDGNLDLAQKLAEDAKQAEPDNTSVSDTLAWIYIKKGAYLPAVRYLEDCISKSPGNATFQYHLGLAYYKLGQMDAAKRPLQIAAANLPPAQAEEARKLLVTIR